MLNGLFQVLYFNFYTKKKNLYRVENKIKLNMYTLYSKDIKNVGVPTKGIVPELPLIDDAGTFISRKCLMTIINCP